MRKPYPSDVSRSQFEIIKPVLEGNKVVTKPRQVDLYEVFCAILYILKNGCTWRALPHYFPDWNLVYYYWTQWQKKDSYGRTLLDHCMSDLQDYERKQAGRKQIPSMIIIHSQTIQNADSATAKGYDGGKKAGFKLHIAVDVLGNLYAATVTITDVGDRKGAIKMFSEMPLYLPGLQLVLTDGGYTGDDFAFHVWDILRADVEVAKRSELHKFIVMPRRWIVERTFAWLDKCRRLWKNCERLLSTTLNFFNLTSISILLRRR